jgi:predicted dehydrogenase
VAVCDVRPDRIERFTRLFAVPASYTDYREMLARERLDAVLVQIGHGGNGPVLRASIEAGVHVLVEKTPVASTADADALVELQRGSGVHVMVGFNRRFMSGYVMAREISRREEFGGVRLYQSTFHAGPYTEGAFAINHVVHHLDLARWLLGEIELTHIEHRVVDVHQEAYALTFRSASGAIGTIHAASMLDDRYPMERLELVGAGRHVVVDNLRSVTYNRPPGDAPGDAERTSLADAGDTLVWNPNHGGYPRFTQQGYESELCAFVTALRAGIEPQPTLADARRSLALVEQLMQG